jgi:hypothetical protein
MLLIQLLTSLCSNLSRKSLSFATMVGGAVYTVERMGAKRDIAKTDSTLGNMPANRCGQGYAFRINNYSQKNLAEAYAYFAIHH